MKDKITLIWYITGVYALIAMLCGMYLPITGNEIAFSLIVFYIGLPIISAVGGYLHAKECNWFLLGQYGCVVCFIAFALPISVFENVWEEVIVATGVATLLGSGIGYKMLKK